MPIYMILNSRAFARTCSGQAGRTGKNFALESPGATARIRGRKIEGMMPSSDRSRVTLEEYASEIEVGPIPIVSNLQQSEPLLT
jgi:hypothetical protein